MKTIKFLLTALSFLMPVLLFCQKQAPASYLNQCIDDQGFNFKIFAYDCFANGKTLIVRIKGQANKRDYYSFLWELDGKPIGKSQNVGCLVGEIATVHITQYPSGRQVSKNIPLHNGPPKD